MQADKKETGPSNAFAVVLGQISHGALAEQASEKLAQLVTEVFETKKKGTLTLKIEIKPRGHDSGQVEVTGVIESKRPIADVAPSMFFAAEDGTLARDNPNQGQLPFGKTEPKKVASE